MEPTIDRSNRNPRNHDFVSKGPTGPVGSWGGVGDAGGAPVPTRILPHIGPQEIVEKTTENLAFKRSNKTSEWKMGRSIVHLGSIYGRSNSGPYRFLDVVSSYESP